MAMTPLPTPPSRSDPDHFAERGDAFLGALPLFQQELDALGEHVDAQSEDVDLKTNAAIAAANASEASAGSANESAAQANVSRQAASDSEGNADNYSRAAAQSAGAAENSAVSAAGYAASIDPQLLSSDHAGPDEPAIIWPYMTWLDTSVNPVMIRRRNAANTAWVEIGPALAGFKDLAYKNQDDLGLKSAAFATVATSPTDITIGRVLPVGYGGVGGSGPFQVPGSSIRGGFYAHSAAGDIFSYGAYANFPYTNIAYGGQIGFESLNGPDVYLTARVLSPLGFGPAVEIRHTGNTTVDSNGFLKNASPIIRLFADRIETNKHRDTENAVLERIGTGHYAVRNTTGLATNGWYIETPKDANGNIKTFVEYEESDGDITVRTYTPDYSTGKAQAGGPADIPDGRWIDIRLNETELPMLEMPPTDGDQPGPGEQEPQYQTQFSVLDFRDRFTINEQIAIRQAQLTDMEVGLVYDAFISAQFIDVTDPRVEQGIELYIAKGLLEPDRKQQLLEPELIPPPAA